MRRRKLEGRLDSMEAMLDKVERGVEKIELVTVVREPNTGMSANAYNGLRKQVIASASERSAHLNQLAQFDSALRAGAGPAELEALVREWLEQASLAAIEDPEVVEAFEVVGPDDAPDRRVLKRGYVDLTTGRVVRAGLIERFHEPADGEPAPADAAATEPSEEIEGLPATKGGVQ
jgi:hypothetical protein